MTNINTLFKKKELQLIADIGFIAGWYGLHGHANAIFDAFKAIRPEHEVGFLGRAIVRILAGDPKAAIEELAQAPVTPATQTFYGIGLVQLGDTKKGREFLEQVTKTAADTPFAKLATEALINLETGVGVSANNSAASANKAIEFDPFRKMS